MKRLKKGKRMLLWGIVLTLVLSTSFAAYGETESANGKSTEASASFAINVELSGHTATLSWAAVEQVTTFRVFGRDGTQISAPVIPSGNGDSFSVEISDLMCAAEAYTYTVKGYASQNDEEAIASAQAAFRIWHTPSPPTITSAQFTGSSKAAVIWKGVENAETYNVYRKTGSGAWTKLAATAGTNYVDNTVSLGGTYRYAIEAVSACCNISSGYNMTGTAASYVAATKITWVSAISKTQVQAKWNPVSGAVGYHVYAKVGSSAWKKVATLPSPTAASYSYKLKGSDWGKNVSFRIYPYCASYTAQVSNTGTTVFKPAKVTLKKVSTAYKVNKITWQKLPDATGYKVYRKTKNGSWKLLKTISKGTTVSYSDKKAKLGTTYYYTVRAYWKAGNKTQVGYYDTKGLAVKSTLAAPSKITAKAKYDKITITWNKVSGAQGYRIYRKAAGGKYVKVATVKANKKRTCTDRWAATGAAYTYTVKAYRKAGGKIHWSVAGTPTKAVRTPIIAKYKKVTDKKSAMYGKTLKLYYDLNGKQIQNAEKYVGKQSKYYLYVNKSKQLVTVYCKDGAYYVPVRAMVCSTGKSMSSTPNGTFKTKAKYRWRELVGKCWGQYCTRINGPILFHSVYYNKYNDPRQLDVAEFNKLGSRASHGCIRLTVKDTKWIYDKCKLKTTTVIHQKTGYEPLAKPTAVKLDSSHKWDPTDPNLKYLCKQKGCH